MLLETLGFLFRFVILASLALILKNGTCLMGIWKVIEGSDQQLINRTECWLPKEKGQGRKIGENGLLYVDRRKLHFWCAYGVVDTKVKTQCCTRETSYAKDQCYFS